MGDRGGRRHRAGGMKHRLIIRLHFAGAALGAKLLTAVPKAPQSGVRRIPRRQRSLAHTTPNDAAGERTNHETKASYARLAGHYRRSGAHTEQNS
jgi:hypothetical protein